LGDAIYKSLSARQSLRAAGHGVEVQRRESVLAAIQGYFDLARAQAQIGVAKEAQKIARNLEEQLGGAVAAGIAYKGDELRARTQTGQTELALRQALELQRTTGARLSEILHLDAAVELVAKETELVPLALIATNVALGSLVEQALVRRPELQQSHSLILSATSARNGAVVGPLIPSLGGQAFVGGLGGGFDNGPGRFGQSEDYSAFLYWRIGPGGLFDFSRSHLAKSRLEQVRLGGEKIRDAILREVVETLARFRSLADQLGTVKHNLETAVEAEKLAEQRKEFAVGAVLEDIQTQQDLSRARSDFVTIVAEYDKAQYALQKAIGNGPDQTEGAASRAQRPPRE
jgi:outer membrane protein TolC